MTKASDIHDSAAQWLIRLEGPTAPDTWDALQAWMDEDPRHRAAFIRLRVAWNRVDRLKNMRPVDGTINSDLLARTNISPAALLIRGLQPLQGTPRKRLEDLLMPDRRRVFAIAGAIALSAAFLIVDGSFFLANLLKVAQGGWLPLSFAALLFLIMTTWRTGTEAVREVIRGHPHSPHRLGPGFVLDPPGEAKRHRHGAPVRGRPRFGFVLIDEERMAAGARRRLAVH